MCPFGKGSAIIINKYILKNSNLEYIPQRQSVYFPLEHYVNDFINLWLLLWLQFSGEHFQSNSKSVKDQIKAPAS